MSNESVIKTILQEAKEIYRRNLQNSDKVDAKLVQLFAFMTALALLFVNIIAFPQNSWPRTAFVVVAALFAAGLVILIRAYRPMKYGSIDPNELCKIYSSGEYKSNVKLLEDLAGNTSESTLSVKQNIRKKVQAIDLCAYFIVVNLVLIILLKVFQGA